MAVTGLDTGRTVISGPLFDSPGIMCGPAFNVEFISGWMRRKAGLDGVGSGVVRGDPRESGLRPCRYVRWRSGTGVYRER